MTEQEQRKIFSDNLCRIMRYKNKIQADMVSHFDVSKSTVSSWCSGAKLPRISTIQNIAEWLDVSREELLLPEKAARIYGGEIERRKEVGEEIGASTFADAELAANAFELGYEKGLLDAKKEPTTISNDEERLLDLYRELNDEGQEKLIEHADDMVQSRKYIKSDPALLVERKA